LVVGHHFPSRKNNSRACLRRAVRQQPAPRPARHAQKQKQKPPPPPPPADTRGAVNQLTHRNKNKNEAKETPI
jgi:hypothetical protein